MKKTIKLILIFAVAIAAAYGLWWAYKNMAPKQQEEQQEETIELTDDTTESINEALEGIDADDLDSEFSEIDKIVDEL